MPWGSQTSGRHQCLDNEAYLNLLDPTGSLTFNNPPALAQSKLDAYFGAGGLRGEATFIRAISFSRGTAVRAVSQKWGGVGCRCCSQRRTSLMLLAQASRVCHTAGPHDGRSEQDRQHLEAGG